MLLVGTPVRVILDKPISNLTNSEKLHGNFRATDIRWSEQGYFKDNQRYYR